MGRISDSDRARNEDAIRAAMDRLLRGELPPGGKCDLKTLAGESGVTRTGFYPKKNRDGSPRPGPYQHLAEEFERRLVALQQAGKIVDPRAAQIERLQSQVAELKDRVIKRDEALAELTAFKTLAVSRIAAQQAEIELLREQAAAGLLQGRISGVNVQVTGDAEEVERSGVRGQG
ncbi:hypothetical protein, partial [Streptomyces sp. NPDC090029]|uniref:hypothetical protein n=1 Tax=Streptomyces sp. NPDC090029 TaxID=3365924 RepID=UPI0038291B0B